MISLSATAQTPISNRGLPAQFLCTPPYYNPLMLDGVTASIDNLRIKFNYSRSSYDFTENKRIDTMVDLLNELTSVPLYMEGQLDPKHKESNFRIGNYAHTITYELAAGSSFAVLVGRYDYKESTQQIAAEAVMDFNPNKVPAKAWKRIIGILAGRSCSICVQRFDLALDFPIPREHLRLMQRPGSRYQLLSDAQYTKTEYTGERSHHSAVKLYDKAAELDLPTPCTRLEITIDHSKFKEVEKLMPEIISLAPLPLSLELDTLYPVVQAILIHPDLYEHMMHSVSRNTWAKYKLQLENYHTNDGDFFLTVPADQLKQIDKYIHTYLADISKTYLALEVIT